MKTLRYEFKYFQDFRGVLRLPKGFMPREVVVMLTPEGTKKGTQYRHSWISK